jgi:hypothetical protein
VLSGMRQDALGVVCGRVGTVTVDQLLHGGLRSSATCTPMPRRASGCKQLPNVWMGFYLPSRWTGAGRGPCLTCSLAGIASDQPYCGLFASGLHQRVMGLRAMHQTRSSLPR